MTPYLISCCSTVDLSPKHVESRNLSYIPFTYMLGDQTHKDDLGASISAKAFYQAMLDGAETRTSQVNVEEFVECFTPILQKGQDILHVCLSSGLSGVYNAACIAQTMLQEQFPDRKIIVVDSLSASSGYGLLMDTLCDMRDAGQSIEDLATFVETERNYLHHWFFSTDLTFFIRGGRVSKASGMIGTMLNICPLLNVDPEGHLTSQAKIRGKKKVIGEIVSRMEANAKNGLAYNDKCYISHSDCLADAIAVKDLIEQKFPALLGKVLINNIGPTIGAHTGPGTVALFFYGKPR